MIKPKFYGPLVVTNKNNLTLRKYPSNGTIRFNLEELLWDMSDCACRLSVVISWEVCY